VLECSFFSEGFKAVSAASVAGAAASAAAFAAALTPVAKSIASYADSTWTSSTSTFSVQAVTENKNAIAKKHRIIIKIVLNRRFIRLYSNLSSTFNLHVQHHCQVKHYIKTD